MRLTRVFLDIDLRNAFDGLRKIADKSQPTKAQQNTPRHLRNDDTTFLFINTARTKFKMLRANQYLVYYSNGAQKIPLEAIQFLPQAFGGTEAEMSQAIRRSIETKLGLTK